MWKSSKKRRHLYFALGGFALLVIASMVAVVATSEWKLSKLVPGGLGEQFPTKVYSAPFSIADRSVISDRELLERMKRLNYHPTLALPPATGEYNWKPPKLTVTLRGFSTHTQSQRLETVTLTRGIDESWAITGSTGATVAQISFEPELLSELSGPQKVRREPATWEDFPPILIDAVIAVEDRRFYKHHGIDFRAILRAAWFNVRHRKNLQGGSTISQQLAKNFFLTQERTLQRKLLEVGFALYLDFRYSKERILTLYLNHIYMGQDGVISVAGMRAAAQFYFGKQLNALTLSDAALLAGIIRSPFRYNPFQNPDAARSRRDRVLKLMLAEDIIAEPIYVKALAMPLALRKRVATPTELSSEHDYFVAEVLRQLVPHFSEDIIFRYGLKIHTTVDPLWQKYAQERIQMLKKDQAALVALEQKTGRVVALVGGRNFRESQFNRATQALRQPGSGFKPFVYGAGLENGFTPASILSDEPRAFKAEKKIWAPQNFDRVYRGPVPFREALAHSINGATLDLAQKIGVPKIIQFAQRMGIASPLEPNLSIALGSSEVTPLEITAAYAPFANGGFKVTPLLVSEVIDAEENVLELNTVERTPVIEPALSYLMTSLLETTISEGTAKSLRELGWTSPSAGKTGTTNAGKDAWFIGYTPGLLSGVWVGDDAAKAANLSGAKNALPIWAGFMKRVYEGRAVAKFEQPSGLVSVKIDPGVGLLARSGCPDQKQEIFLNGTEPKAYCQIHAGGLRGWFKRIFQKKTKTGTGKTGEPIEEAGYAD